MKSIFTLILLLAPVTARADINFGAIREDSNVATLTTGAEQGLVLGMGYARVLSFAGRPLVLGGDVALQWAEVDPSDFRVRAGGLLPLITHGRWKLIGGLSSTVRGTNNQIARMISAGTDATLLAGRYSRRWYAAAEAGFDWALATHVEHSDDYRMQVFAEARDGWYGNPGGTFRYGVQGGVSFGRNDVILRAGKLVDVAGKPPLLPIYATLGYDRRW
jgi:hypothetical protein